MKVSASASFMASDESHGWRGSQNHKPGGLALSLRSGPTNILSWSNTLYIKPPSGGLGAIKSSEGGEKEAPKQCSSEAP